jgi:hypothetical protein
MQDTLFYAHTIAKNEQFYINLYKDRSRFDSKNHEVTTRDGHVRGILCNVKMSAVDPADAADGIANLQLAASGAPNSWKMRNAFRKFHSYRELMFEHSGITEDEKGRYGKTIRPYLDVEHITATELIPVGYNSAGGANTWGVGEWTFSQFATVPLYEAAGVAMADSLLKVADKWPVHICEDNVEEVAEDKTSGTYSSVGMIHSYNLDRQDVVTPGADNVVEGPSNPLAALIASGNQATGEILNIAEDQELELPPYDQADDGDSTDTVIQGWNMTKSTGGTVSFNCFLPAGIIRIRGNQAASLGIEVTVLGDMLCKDMA